MCDWKTGWLLRAPSIVLVLFLTACKGEAGDSGQAEQPLSESRTVPVTTQRARTQEVVDELFSVGKLVSRNTPSLAAEIDARVVEVLLDEGEVVAAGQLLVRLDTTSAELQRREAQAEIQRIKASIENEKRRVARYRDLKTKNVMPQERLDDAEVQLAVDQASLAAAEARLAITQDRLNKAQVHSPVAGVVEARYVSRGDFVSIGTPLLMITDTSRLRAEMPFPETVGHRLRRGQTVMIESAVAPGQLLEARIDQIRPQVGKFSRALVALADIQNPGLWRPEATIEARVVVERRKDTVVVPELAVVKRPGGYVVYVLQSGQAQQRLVTIGQQDDSWVEVRQGIEPGEEIIVEGAHYLSDGVSVVVRQKTP